MSLVLASFIKWCIQFWSMIHVCVISLMTLYIFLLHQSPVVLASKFQSDIVMCFFVVSS